MNREFSNCFGIGLLQISPELNEISIESSIPSFVMSNAGDDIDRLTLNMQMAIDGGCQVRTNLMI